jgi:hypothetical protein
MAWLLSPPSVRRQSVQSLYLRFMTRGHFAGPRVCRQETCTRLIEIHAMKTPAVRKMQKASATAPPPSHSVIAIFLLFHPTMIAVDALQWIVFLAGLVRVPSGDVHPFRLEFTRQKTPPRACTCTDAQNVFVWGTSHK